MKKILVFILLVIILSGCASMKTVRKLEDRNAFLDKKVTELRRIVSEKDYELQKKNSQLMQLIKAYNKEVLKNK